MGTEKLIKYLDKPENLNASSLTDLEELVNEYPFFQTAHLLRVKNVQNIYPEIDKQILNLTAAYVSDRKVLYYLLHSFQAVNPEPYANEDKYIPYEKDYKDSLHENISETINKQKDIYELEPDHEIELIPGLAIDIRKEYGTGIDLENLDISFTKNSVLQGTELLEIATGKIDEEIIQEEDADIKIDTENSSFELDVELSIVPDSGTPEPKEEEEEARSRSFTDWLNTVNAPGDSSEVISEDTKEVRGEDLKLEIAYDFNKLAQESKIDDDSSVKDLNSDSLIDRFIQHNPKIVPSESIKLNEDKSLESAKEHESFFTDTLARIYIRQGNYAKAIFAYEKLSLKYPEKSAYFAGQISEIKKLISK